MVNDCNCKPEPKNKQNYYSIVLRHDTSTQWMIENPILLFGEYGVEDDTHKVKRGDGTSKWENLPYETFGIESIITFGNLLGEVEDNAKLAKALNDKLSKDAFKDTDGNIISALNIIKDDGSICKVERHTSNIISNNTDVSTLLIESPDNSLKGVWTVNDEGITTLQLSAVSTICEFTPNTSYSKNQLCFYEGNLYISKESIEASETFDKESWSLVGANNASEIKFDNTGTEIKSESVQEAIKELSSNITQINSQLNWKDYD